MLAAIFEGGDQVKAFPQALAKAAQVSSEIYNEHKEEKGKYWETYYKGTQERDTKGLEVDLGGSKAFNLADNLNLFGLAPGSNNNAKATYTTFANIVMKNYGEMFKKTPIPSYQDAMTSRYILIAQSLMDTSAAGQAEKTSFTQGGEGALVSSRSYHITFATGSDQIVGDGVQTMNELKDSLSIAGGTYISIDGYTDNTGSDSVNIPLSKRRAQAVKQWLQRAAPGNFPDSRFARVEGHGSQDPVAANTSESGKSQNRRVEITLSAQ
jgi:outer membrane protein OmpA-like peptidoglycan-associated protein